MTAPRNEDPPMSVPADRQPDDTLVPELDTEAAGPLDHGGTGTQPPDPDLADDLLGPRPENAETPVTDEDDDYLIDAGWRRSKLTVALIVALIFALGVITGVQLNKLFAPKPAAQIVVVLNSASPTTALPSPTSSPR